MVKVMLRSFMIVRHMPRNSHLLKIRCLPYTSSSDKDGVFNTPGNIQEPPIPEYKPRMGEDLEVKRARILYQSRKRGMLENDLLLSNFANKYLSGMNETQLDMYDTIINKPDNDWDIYNWITGKKEVPEEFNNEIMEMMKKHAKNEEMEDRTRMPDLKL